MNKKSIVTAVSAFVCALIATSLCIMSFASGIVYGDADGDGKITAADARLILRYAVGLDTLDKVGGSEKALDVDGDGKVTAADARLVLRRAVSLDSAFPVETASDTQSPAVSSDAVPSSEGPSSATGASGTTAAPTVTSVSEKPTVTEPTTAPTTEHTTEPTTTPTTEPTTAYVPTGDLATLSSGKYYVKGTVHQSDGTEAPLEEAVDGTGVYYRTTVNKYDLSMLYLKSGSSYTCYLISNSIKYYCPLSTSMIKALFTNIDKSYNQDPTVAAEDKLDATEAQNIMEALAGNTKALSGTGSSLGAFVSKADITEDGKTYTAVTYKTSYGSTLRYILDGDKLVRTDTLDSAGNVTSFITWSSVSADTSDLLAVPSGYTKSSTLYLMLSRMNRQMNP